MKSKWIYILLTNPILVGVIFFFLFIFIASNPYLSYDEGIWTYIGRIWHRLGVPPYLSAVENKTPGIYVLFAFSDIFSFENIFLVRLLGLFAVILSSFFIYLIGKLLHSQLTGVISMYFFGLINTWYLVDGFSFAQTETFMVLFSILSFYFLILSTASKYTLSYLFLSGFCIGIAILFKQIALTTLIALLLFYIIVTTKKISKAKQLIGISILIVSLSIALVISCFVMYFSGVSLKEYIDGSWLILFNSGSRAPDLKFHFINFLKTFFTTKFIFIWPFIGLLFFYKYLLKNIFFTGLLIWLLFDFIGVNASGYYYGHQLKQLLPSIALILSFILTEFIINKHTDIDIKKKIIMVISCLIIYLMPYKHLYKNYKAIQIYKYQQPAYIKISSWIKKNTNQNDYIYVVGNDMKLILSLTISERVSSSKYLNAIFLSRESDRQLLYSDLKNKPPKLILKIEKDSIDSKVYGKEVTSFFKNNYSKVNIIEGCEILKQN